uniref:NADH-ubiquinone oxidoreductase chain 5 n=1 Tax=Turritopsis dohrnii TaxID=308579 RepID=A0A1B0TFV5_9CNID|nr:NADH dehydrogenase subunit 5 [Turritopsis dohrnii]ALK27154.1 NADH dehydrogenase subunit 5 [Turritopsis dohrnii]
MYLLILLLPLLSFLVCFIFGRKVGNEGVKIVSVFSLSLTLFIVCILWKDINMNQEIFYIKLWDWINVGVFNSFIHIQYDQIVATMLMLIIFISLLVHLYSTFYMEGDPHLPRFMSYLSLFTLFMIILVTSSNLIQLSIGWEGVGLCSYLLINFWYTRIQANKSAIKAMVVNKVGDLGMLLAMMLIFLSLGSLNYNVLIPTSYFLDYPYIMDFSCFLLLIGVIGKSAQIGLHMWLPDAMEGPTPVSALIHAATMVTAGVFLIIRLSPFFEKSPTVLIIIIFVGSLTAFFSASIGLVQNDIKKVIAYSTCSQLGYMVMICGFSYYDCGLFHLFNHGFFKALLFLSAGSIIHAIRDEQDIRKMGNLIYYLPFSYICILVGSISLMGLPFLTGFYSKDLILEIANTEYIYSYALWLGLLSASFTAFYSFRLICYVFINKTQLNKINLMKIHEGGWNLIICLFALCILSVSIGYFTQFTIIRDYEPLIILNNDKMKPLYLTILGVLLCLLFFFNITLWWKSFTKKSFKKVYSFVLGSWYFDYLINHYIVKPFMKVGFNVSYKFIDNQILEFFGPTIIYNKVTSKANELSKFYSGNISIYTFMFIAFIYCFLIKF